MIQRTQKHTRLSVGDRISVQHQTGLHPTKWDRSGIVVECKDHDQYLVKLDGTGRLTRLSETTALADQVFCQHSCGHFEIGSILPHPQEAQILRPVPFSPAQAV